MIWLTLRQFRAQAIVAGAALGALAIVLAVAGPHLASLYSNSGLADCHTGCGALASNFFDQIKGTSSEIIFYFGIALSYVAPAIMGMFWGAPLITRELEAGTFRLAWNQSVPRARWVAVKLGLISAAAVAAAGLLSLMTSWWASPLYAAASQAGSNSLSINRLGPPLFGATGIVPLSYAAFAFALGVTVGVLIRRTLPAMAITVAAFAAIQILWPSFVRPHLVTPAHATQSLDTVSFNQIGDHDNGTLLLQVGSVNGLPGDWITRSEPVNAAGLAITKVPSACMSITSNFFVPCLAKNGVRLAVSYQPASRYWTLQLYETGIFIALALGLGGFCYWRVRRFA